MLFLLLFCCLPQIPKFNENQFTSTLDILSPQKCSLTSLSASDKQSILLAIWPRLRNQVQFSRHTSKNSLTLSFNFVGHRDIYSYWEKCTVVDHNFVRSTNELQSQRQVLCTCTELLFEMFQKANATCT